MKRKQKNNISRWVLTVSDTPKTILTINSTIDYGLHV